MAPEGNDGVVNDGSTGASSGSSGSTGSTGSTGSSTGATGSPTGSTKWEDDPRAKGILNDLQKERKARQDEARQRIEYEARLAERDRQIAALTNSKLPTAEEAEAAEIRNKFASIVPREALMEMLGLTEDDIEAIRNTKTVAEQAQEAVQHRWTEHSRKMLSGVYEKIGAEVGDLSPAQQRRVAALYVAEAEANPEFLKRHDAGDVALIDEFVKAYLDDMVEPVRRKVTATEAGRFRPVPNGGNRTLPQAGGKPIDVTDDKAVMDLIMESRRGKFSR